MNLSKTVISVHLCALRHQSANARFEKFGTSERNFLCTTFVSVPTGLFTIALSTIGRPGCESHS
jgi:hypothetical protein